MINNKRYFFPLFLVFFLLLGETKSSVEWEKLSGDEIDEYNLNLEKNDREGDFLYLFQAKNYLINGGIKRALFYLDKINDNTSKLSLIKRRYQGLIAFIQGDYQNAYRYFSTPYFNNAKYYPHICIMKVMSLMALKEYQKMDYELLNCRAITIKYSKNQQIWLDSLADLALKKPYALKGGILQNVTYLLEDPEYLRIWLKMAIYLNRDEVALKNISSLHESSYQSKKVREMIGLLHYRNNNFDLAIKFIEDIDSSNAENIKGNINLFKKEYELAYGHFKLALKHKKNSLNAIERAIPLTWLLGEWDDGLDLLGRMSSGATASYQNKTQNQNEADEMNLNLRKKLALETAILMRKKNYTQVQKNILDLKYLYKEKMPAELEMMYAYNSLMTGDLKNLIRFSEQSCHNFDGISCWIYLNNHLWENLPRVIKRDEEIRQDSHFSISSLKESQAISPLEEEQLVNQKDIEELDSNQIPIEFNSN